MNSEAIEEVAVRWLVKRVGDAWTDADQARLDAWLNECTAHRIAFIRLDAVWREAARMKALGAGVPAGTIPPRGAWGSAPFFGQSPPRATVVASTEPPAEGGPGVQTASTSTARTRAVAWRYWSLAATVLLMLAIGLYTYNTEFLRGDRYSTHVGGRDTVPLADGSQVTLNTNSRIRVELTPAERRIELDKGEAFFEVAKDEARPFVVLAGDKRVVAVGTKFSVRRHANDIEVVVTEGRVRLESVGAAAAPPTQLDVGAVARTAKSGVLVREQALSDVEQLLTWRSGYLTFRDTALADAVAEFNRYNTRKIVIEDASIATIRIGGNFRTDNEDAFLWLLQNGFPILVQQSEDRIVLSAR